MYKLCTATPSMNKVTFSMVILCFRCLFIYNFKRWRLHILKPSAFYIYILCQIMYKNSGGMSFYVQKKGRVCHAMYIFSAIFPEKPKNYVFLCRKKLCPFMSPFSLVTIYTCIYTRLNDARSWYQHEANNITLLPTCQHTNTGHKKKQCCSGKPIENLTKHFSLPFGHFPIAKFFAEIQCV